MLLSAFIVPIVSMSTSTSMTMSAVAAPADAGVSAAPAQASAPVPRSLLAPLPAPPGQGAADEYRLLRAKDGTGDLLYDAAGFTGRVARDGSVAFRDKHVSGINLLPFLPVAGPTGVPTLQSTLRGMRKKGGAGGTPGTPAPAMPPDPIADETRAPSTTVSRYRPDPREACQYPQSCFFDAPVLLVGGQVRVDITDEIMRFAGQDPYRYDKARFLNATRDLRIRMAGRAHAENVSRSGAALPALLETIACDDRMSPGERRAILQALRAELDVATPEARAYQDQIQRFLSSFVGADGPDGGVRCPPR